MTAVALALLAALSLSSLPFWRENLPVIHRFRLRAGAVVLLSVLALALIGWLAVEGVGHDAHERELAVGLVVVTSVASGGPVAKAVLRLADRGTPAAPQGPARTTVLTGGAWIGALERVAVTVTLLAHWPEGLALVLVVKGLGRYPELRSAGHTDQPGTAERFIIGTFASALWGAGCAGVGMALVR